MKHFFDVGANVGQTFDDYLLPRTDYDGCKVWCFEPSPRNYAALLKRVVDLSKRFQIVVCPFGLSANWATLPFYEKFDSRGDSFVKDTFFNKDRLYNKILRRNKPVTLRAAEYDILGVTVPTVEFILSHTAPDDEVTLKLDCEGSEIPILKELAKSPLALGRVNKIMVEWHFFKDAAIDQRALEKQYKELGKRLIQWKF